MDFPDVVGGFTSGLAGVVLTSGFAEGGVVAEVLSGCGALLLLPLGLSLKSFGSENEAGFSSKKPAG